MIHIFLYLLLAAPLAAQRTPNAVDIRSTGASVEALALVRAFPALTFSSAVHLAHAGDGSNRLFVVERQGLIRVFANQPEIDRAETFLDIRDRVRSTPLEAGLFSVAFHPDYAANGRFYVHYIHGQFASRISEFSTAPDNPNRALASSERILLEIPQPHESHNGGQVAFGPDGMLYFSLGDGQDPDDPFGHGQNPGTLFSAILRIDVDFRSGDLAYGIPPDNPFVGRAGWRGEIWAYGLRNVWRFSFDRLGGELWAGDVGQSSWEEIDLVAKGRNYGWSRMEGFHCFPPGADCNPAEYDLPVFEYDRSQGNSVTGGFVYRGPGLPDLQGWYVYGDFASRRVWALRRRPDGPPEHQLLATASSAVASFGEDESGELYVVGFDGRLWRFAARDPAAAPDRIPATISASGIFADIQRQTPAPGLIPYAVNAPLWSDGAGKTRLLALPDTARIAFATDTLWTFPPRTVFVKNFYLKNRIVETRLLVKRVDPESPEWDGYSYLWNEAGTDASLLPADTTIAYARADGRLHAHYFPSRSECATCHTPQAGYVLGFRTPQLNRPRGDDNQLDALARLDIFATYAGPASNLPRLPDPADPALPVALRARAYLDANCSSCHRPGGTGRGELDLRFDASLQALLGQRPLLGDLGIPDAQILRPAAPQRSLLFLRPATREKGRMPPLATSVVDTFGLDLLQRWIEGLQATAVAHTAPLPQDAQLYPIYPNPFNAATSIPFALDRPAPVRLAIYSLSGQQLRVLLDHAMPAGIHHTTWNGADARGRPVASGVYLFRLTTPTTTHTTKALLLK